MVVTWVTNLAEPAIFKRFAPASHHYTTHEVAAICHRSRTLSLVYILHVKYQQQSCSDKHTVSESGPDLGF
jgi:hypothetical protein